MKDLYTFDVSRDEAIETYHQVSAAYRAFFTDLKLPVTVAEASSGNMGGDYSHEYHLTTPIGEDTVISCSHCGYAANDEVACARPPPEKESRDPRHTTTPSDFCLWRGISRDGKTLVNAWYPAPAVSNYSNAVLSVHAIKAIVPELDTSIENPLKSWEEALRAASSAGGPLPRLVNVVDSRLASAFRFLHEQLPLLPADLAVSSVEQSTVSEQKTGARLNLLQVADGDACPRCDTGSLRITRALELAHTFHLGTRYSAPLEAHVSLPRNPSEMVPVQMGCHGIGISRILGAVAEHLADDKGLVWPRAIAPFDVVMIPTSHISDEIVDIYDKLASEASLDVVLDDRRESFGWKMRDADVTGYPVTVVLGKAWREKGMCEVQCRRQDLRDDVSVEKLPQYLQNLLAKL